MRTSAGTVPPYVSFVQLVTVLPFLAPESDSRGEPPSLSLRVTVPVATESPGEEAVRSNADHVPVDQTVALRTSATAMPASLAASERMARCAWRCPWGGLRGGGERVVDRGRGALVAVVAALRPAVREGDDELVAVLGAGCERAERDRAHARERAAVDRGGSRAAAHARRVALVSDDDGQLRRQRRAGRRVDGRALGEGEDARHG